MKWVAAVPTASNHQRIAELKLLYALLGWSHLMALSPPMIQAARLMSYWVCQVRRVQLLFDDDIVRWF